MTTPKDSPADSGDAEYEKYCEIHDYVVAEDDD